MLRLKNGWLGVQKEQFPGHIQLTEDLNMLITFPTGKMTWFSKAMVLYKISLQINFSIHFSWIHLPWSQRKSRDCLTSSPEILSKTQWRSELSNLFCLTTSVIDFERKWLLDFNQLSMQKNLWFLQKFAPKSSWVICFTQFSPHMRLFTLSNISEI